MIKAETIKVKLHRLFHSPPKAIAFGTEVSLEIVKNLSFSKERFLTLRILIPYIPDGW